MAFVLLMLLQASAPAGGAPVPSDFDLKDVAESDRLKLGIRQGCGSKDPTAIVICGRRDPDRYRLKELPSGYEEQGLPQARIDLGGGATAGIVVDQVAFPDGTVSTRAMIKVKVPF